MACCYLNHPLDSAELVRWALSRGLKDVVDMSMLTAVQIHYTAAPRFEAPLVDPLRRRSGLLCGDRDAAALVAPPAPERRRFHPAPRSETLSDQVALEDAAALLRQSWPEESVGWHRAVVALAGWLLRRGWATEAVEGFISSAAPPRSQPRRDDEVGDAVRATARRLEAGERVTGWSTLRDLVGDDVARGARRALRARDRGRSRPRPRPYRATRRTGGRHV